MSTVDYILKNFKFEENPCLQAVKLGNLEIVKILYEKNFFDLNFDEIMEYASYNTEVFKYLLEKYYIDFPDNVDDEFKDWVLNETVSIGDIELVKWATQYFDLIYTQESIRLALERGYFEIVDFIYYETCFKDMNITPIQIEAILYFEPKISSWFYNRYYSFMDTSEIILKVSEKLKKVRESKENKNYF